MAYEIRQGDVVEVLRTLPDEHFQAVVTSPPYNNGTDYGVYDDSVDEVDYLHLMGQVAHELRRVLTPSGSLFLNIGFVAGASLLDLQVAWRFMGRFALQNRIAWVKSIFDGERTRGQFRPIMSERYLNRTWENVFHFTRDGNVPLDRTAIGVPFEDQNNLARFGHKENKRCRGNAWLVPYETTQEAGAHPCPFPEALVELCLRLHGVEKITTVLDPFVGSGTTLLVAEKTGLDSVGIELNPEYVALAEARLHKAFGAQGRLAV